jgi:hypothetical protein
MMIFLKLVIKLTILLPLFTSFALSQSFEQNGVKDGNVRLSMSLYSEQPQDESNSADFDIQSGYFINDNIEILFRLGLEKMRGADEFYYRLTPGLNYYFYNTPIFTPYVGARVYYWNSSYEYIQEKKGSSLSIGSHFFVNENVAISPELGIDFIDFESKDATYFSTSLSYFF